MKIKDLKEILSKYNENTDISFGRVDDDGNSYCSCEVEIEIDRIYGDLNITVL